MTPPLEHNPDAADRVTCPFCAESVKREAKVCPRCRQWLTIRSLHNPAVTVWLYGLPQLAILAFLAMSALNALERLQNPKPDYSAHIGSLQVLESRMNWANTSNGPRIYVTGVLTNRSEFAWRDVELECRFLDSTGRLMDAGHPRVGLTVQPHDDAAFRATITPSQASNDYASFRVSVSTARTTKGLF